MAARPLPHPECFHVRAALGWLELGSVAESRHELSFVAAWHREHPDVLEIWWKIFAEEKDWPAALASAERLATVAPERDTGWVEQAFALHELRRTPEAYERLARVVEQFPKAYVIPYNLACYQCQMGQREEAWRWLKRAVKAADVPTIRAMAMQDPDLAPLRDELARLK